jgi:hypothetical protein
MIELETRFTGVARSRSVSVKFQSKGSIGALDYHVAFKAKTNTFKVVLRRDGCFEGAYRCIERFIEVKAEILDGVYRTPDDHLDYWDEMHYWIIEKIYEQFRSDLESAITDKVSSLERAGPGEGVLGNVNVKTRMRSLIGMQTHLHQADGEVRRGVLFP